MYSQYALAASPAAALMIASTRMSRCFTRLASAASRLEQRIGRIKRFGQARTSVDMLNLVYSGTRDEVVYERLSARMKDRYDLFGSLPDVIEDEWIEDLEKLELRLSAFFDKKKRANAFDLRYADTVDPKGEPWERCAEVLSRRDIVERLSKGW